ncbi:MAG TPA: glycosyltransferase [Lysobacter sp.]
MPERPVVSVCIANYNGERLLPECIESVLAQNGGHAIEIIVHDDASTDDSVALLRQRYPQVELLASEENVGFCASNNRMVEHARGEFVLLLNNDAALFPDALSTLFEAARATDPGILTLPQYDWETNSLIDRGCLLDPFCNPVPNLDASRSDVAYVIGACLWCSRETWRALGGFPEWMESLAEDLYLCGVARLRGMPVRALTNSGYRHRQGATFGGNRAGSVGLRTSVKRRRLSERNKTRALVILTPGIAMWPLLAAHLLALFVEGAVLSLLRRDGTLWREVYAPAIGTPFHEAHELGERRRAVQATRTISVGQWFSAVRWQLRKVAMLWRYGVPTVK